jgi:hypothetical protein
MHACITCVGSDSGGTPRASRYSDGRQGPEEPEHAFLLWMAACLEAEPTDTQIEKFRRLLLTIPMRFKVIASEEARLFAHANLRETITGSHACMSRTATQRVYEVCQWRDRRMRIHGTQNATASKLAQLWNEQVHMARSSEPITEAFMAMSFRLWEQLLSHENCRKLILWAERTWGKLNPLDSVVKLEAVLTKAKGSVEHAEWLLGSIIFYVKCKYNSHGELSVRNLTGKNAGNRGLLDMWLLKRNMWDYIASTVLDSASFNFTKETKARSMALSQNMVGFCMFFGKRLHEPVCGLSNTATSSILLMGVPHRMGGAQPAPPLVASILVHS